MRNAFISELVDLVDKGSEILLVVGDLGFSVVEPFVQRHPQRFVNAGVAEQNMTGLAAGLASEGYRVFTYSIANFPTFRCAEQFRNDVDYQNLPVTVVAVGGGLAYGALGYSHHAVQDYGLMRLFPNCVIASPGDPQEVRACLRFLIQSPGPSYLRLGKAGEPNVHSSVPVLALGAWLRVLGDGGAGTAVVVTGAPLNDVLGWARELSIAVDVYSCPVWGMSAKSAQLEYLKLYRRVLTVEDHLHDGGFGSWLTESAQGLPPALRPEISVMALSSGVCGMVGSQQTLNAVGGLSRERFEALLLEQGRPQGLE